MRSTLTCFLFCFLVGCSASDEAPAPPPPLPDVIGASPVVDLNPDPRILEFNLTASATTAQLTDGTPTNVLAYNGMTPGPLLLAHVGDRVIVHFQNDLDEPTTIHWHGLRISSDMDGNPMVQPPIAPGASFTYDFTLPDAGTFWYHPHANTIEQIDRGMYGAIVVTEAAPPQFSAERLMVLDDIRLGSSNQISSYAHTGGHDVVHGREGNILLQNGHESPIAGTAAHGAIERWRILNAATARTMSLAVEGATFRVIGTDGGLLPAPYSVDRIEIGVGQRFDLEVTYSDASSTAASLISYVLALDASNNVIEMPVPVAQIALDGVVSPPAPVYPLVTLPTMGAAPVDAPITLSAEQVGSQLVFTINGVPGDQVPVASYTQNQSVRITITDQVGTEHPFHFHGQFFQVLSRDGGGDVEPGLKDTVLVHGQETVTLFTNFENLGQWMYHCHIPEHAENGMMAELDVVAPAP